VLDATIDGGGSESEESLTVQVFKARAGSDILKGALLELQRPKVLGTPTRLY